MKTIQIEIPDGKKAEWVNGVLTLVEDKPIEYKFKVGDRVLSCDGAKYKITGLSEVNGMPGYSVLGFDDLIISEDNLIWIVQDITERIKTFEDACKWCEANGRTSLVCQHDTVREEFRVFSEDVKKDILAYLKLRIITYALNEGWVPSDGRDKFVYVPKFNDEMRSIATTVGAFGDSALKLAFKSENLAAYAATQFADIYGDFCGVKKKGGEQ